MTKTEKAERLLATYNKYSPYKRTVTAKSPDEKRFGTWAYANEYDALYDTYSQNKNFNANMWRESIARDEQDNYLALLEQNKNNTLSNRFYDEQYYDYETMMTELYLPLADNTKLEKYDRDVFDQATGKWVKEDLGEMTQRQYLEYTLNNARAAKAAEIQREVEQTHKDAMSFWQKFGHDTAATLGELGEGLLTGITGVIDFVGGFGYATFGQQEDETWADAFVRYFGEIGLTQMEKRTIRHALDEYERKNTHFRDIDGNMTNVGKYVAGISNSIGMMLPSILLAIPTGGTSLAFLPQLTFYTSIFSNNMYESATDPTLKDRPSWTKILNVTVKTAAEWAIEKALGAFLGATIQNRLLGIGGRNLGTKFISNFGKWSGVKYLAKSAGQEGLEEFLQDFSTSLIDAFTDLVSEGYVREGVNMQALIDSFFIGALSSIVMSTGHVSVAATMSSIRNAKDPGSGDTVIEVDGELKKVRGFNRLYYGQILSDFQSAVKELKDGKFGTRKNLALAEDVYGALSAISQFYSSFDQARIKNCEMLLDRLVKNENREKAIINKFTEKNSRVAQILTPDTLSAIMKSEGYDFVKETTSEFVGSIESAFKDMVVDASLRHQIEEDRKAAEKAAKKAASKLNDGGVTKVNTASSAKSIKRNPDGTIEYEQNEEVARLEAALGKKKASRLLELHKYYDNICTVDGHVAIEEDGFLFVSEGWLENYKTSEIYQFLHQNYMLETIRKHEKLKPFVKTLVEFYKNFTNRTTIVGTMTDTFVDEVLMQFFFNPSFYQAFILSENGKYVHKYKETLFILYGIVLKQGEEWLKLSENEPNIKHDAAVFEKVQEEIKKAWREPTMKAIINWGFEPQVIKADLILEPRDLEFIGLIGDHKRILHTMGKTGTPAERSAHRNLVDKILKRADAERWLTTEEREIITRVEEGKGSVEEQVTARVLLDRLDHRASLFSVGEYLFVNDETEIIIQKVHDYLFWARGIIDNNDPDDDNHFIFYDSFLDEARALEHLLSSDERKTFRSLIEKYRSALNEEDADRTREFAQQFIEFFVPISARYDDVSSLPHHPGNMAFVIPHEAAELAMGGDTAGAQHVADAINEFVKIYGVTPKDYLLGRIENVSAKQLELIRTTMTELHCTDAFSFVQRSLEKILGNDYVVVPDASSITGKSFESVIGEFFMYDVFYHPSYVTDEGIAAYRKLTSEAFPDEVVPDFSSDEGRIILKQIIKETWPKTTWPLFAELILDGTDPFTGEEISTNPQLDKFYADLSSKLKKDYALSYGGIRICRKLPASTMLPAELLDTELDDEQTSEIIINMFLDVDRPAVRKAIENTKQEFRKIANSAMPAHDDAAYALYCLEEREEETLQSLVKGIIPGYGIHFFDANVYHDKDYPAAITDRAAYEQWGRLFEALTTLKLSDIIDVSNFKDPGLRRRVKNYTLKMLDLSESNVAGWQNRFTETIVIGSDQSDILNTLVHETNHLLEGFYLQQYGAFKSDILCSPEMMAHLVNNYHTLVDFFIRQDGSPKFPKTVTKDWIINESTASQRNTLAEVGYWMAQGELWARSSTHNKFVRGITEGVRKGGSKRLIAPDGTEFIVNSNTTDYKKNSERIDKIEAPKITDAMLEATTRHLVNVWKMHATVSAPNAATNPDVEILTRDTYHTRFTRQSKKMLDSLLNPTLDLYSMVAAKLSDIIRDPQTYLRPDMLELLEGDFSEGNVFYFIKDYVEEMSLEEMWEARDAGEEWHPAVSIDIAADSFEYIFVDDNLFSDLLVPAMQERVESKDTSIYKAYGGNREGVSLSKFYDKLELYKYDVLDTRVVIHPDVKTEAVFDEKNARGIIYINANEETSDAYIIHRLNHEFRHLLQRHSGFHLGFTPDIKVTPEMIADMKKHAPGFFDNSFVRKVAEHHKKDNESLESTIARMTIYNMVAGEQSAYAYSALDLYLKPVLTRREGGDISIYMPWYDPNTKEGLYETKELATRAVDDETKKPLAVTEEELKTEDNRKWSEERRAARKEEIAYAREHLPRKIVKPKYESHETDVTPEGIIKHVYKYKNNRHFTKKKAKGTNLMYFYRVGEQNQMDLNLQNFIIDTTDHLAELPYSLRESIKKGTLTKQALFRFICDITVTDPDNANYINDYTFNLLKKHFFPNTPFKSIQEVDRFLTPDKMQMYWAAVPYFYHTFRDVEKILEQNTVEAFEEFINLAENSDKKAEFMARAYDFGRIKILDSNGNTVNLEKYTDWVLDKKKYDAAVAAEEKKAKKEGRKPRHIFEIDYQIEVEKTRVGDIAGFVPDWQLENRVSALQNFDGSLGGAFYVAWNARKKLAWQYIDIKNVSLNQSKKTARGEGTALIDTLADADDKTGEIETDTDAAWNQERDAELEANFALEDNDDQVGGTDTHKHKHTTRGPDKVSYGTDIISLYVPPVVDDADFDDMKDEVRVYLFNKLMSELVPNFSELSEDEQYKIASGFDGRKQMLKMTQILKDVEQVEAIYAEMKANEALDINADIGTDEKQNDRLKARVNVQTRAKNHGRKIAEAIRDGWVSYEELPNDVKMMFRKVEGTTSTGKKINTYELDPAFYEVGRGRKALAGKKDVHHTRAQYSYKYDITESRDVFKHDTTQIFQNEQTLKSAWNAVKKEVKLRKKAAKKSEKIQRDNVKNLTATEKKKQQELESFIMDIARQNTEIKKNAKLSIAEAEKRAKEAERPIVNIQYTIKAAGDGKAKHATLTLTNPNGVVVPDFLKKVFSTSFSYGADTKVQWASIDADGNLYKGDNENAKSFESMRQHEIADWKVFMELNGDILNNLTREDVLDAAKCLYTMHPESPKDAGKYTAFKIFLYGFFYAGARDNTYGWNFSDKEVDYFRELYESFASNAGVALNAVKQMLPVIKPLMIGSKFLDAWETVSQDEKDNLAKLVEDMQKERDPQRQLAFAKQITAELDLFASRELARTKAMGPRWSKIWWSKVWGHVKTYRYLAMLSGPGTWVRNALSNWYVKGLNAASDTIGAFIFRNKDYRTDQWDLRNTQVSAEVKDFTKLYIEENPAFKHAYEMSGRYDNRGKLKNDADIAMAVITNAYLKHYKAEHSRAVVKFIQKRMSDEKFIKTAVHKYLNKMLTIEVDKGNVDLADGLTGKIYALFADAVIQANEEYMHKRSPVVELLDDKFREKYPKTTEAINFFFPFLNSGFNWFVEEAINLSPVGLIKSIGRARKLDKQITTLDERRAKGDYVVNSRAAEFLVRRGIGKGVVGTMLWTLGAILCLMGRLRIEEEKDKFFLNVGDIRVDISNMFGSSSLLIGASMVQAFVDGNNETGIETMAGYVTDAFLNGFFVADMMDRHAYDDNKWDFFTSEVNNTLTSFFPQFLQVFVDGLDNQKIRYSAGLKGNWEYFINSIVPTQPAGNKVINVYTGELEDKDSLPFPGGGLFRRGILGPKIYWVEISEAERMCREYGANHNELSGEITINGQKKKLDRFSLNKKYGELNKASLAEITSQKHKVEMPNGKYKTLHWNDLTDDQRKRVIDRTFSHNANIAKIYIWTQEMGNKYYASTSDWQDLKALGITKNVYKGDKGFVE